jgi:hypothetical protein
MQPVLLNTLEPIFAAAWNADTTTHSAPFASGCEASMCTPGTRVSILEDILAWAAASDSPCVFWLNGLAGTGKSTIARTLCKRLNEMKLLGASFFVSRDEADRRNASKIVHSLAHQLAVFQDPLWNSLCAKLREKPVSATRSLHEQIKDFIVTPAHMLQGNTAFIIVIDALDECFTDSLHRPGGDILLLLVKELLQVDGRLKLFLTSRAETPIVQMFRQLSANAQTSVFTLHELDETVVRDDITTYLAIAFAEIRVQRLGLALGEWPRVQDINELAKRSGRLFIYAATAVRFVKDPNYSPRRRLTLLLDQDQAPTGASVYGPLDALYRQILSDAVRGSGDDEGFLCRRLQAVVAVIVLAQTVVDVETLALLAGLDPDDSAIVVDSLLSLLADKDSGVRVFHPSFPDFAVDSTRCMDPRLRVTPLVDHGTIALQCLLLMNQHLRYNVCNLEDHTVANEEVHGLYQRLFEKLPNALRYAVCFWCTHLKAAGSPDRLLLNTLDEFCRTHLFHWVEVLSLGKYVPPAEAALLQVIKWCQV